uniref:Uncharacterized protein n=1 Tax=Anguilla anguilla TaxID=7936 RepID=A0A0E9XK52_ANGAN
MNKNYELVCLYKCHHPFFSPLLICILQYLASAVVILGSLGEKSRETWINKFWVMQSKSHQQSVLVFRILLIKHVLNR